MRHLYPRRALGSVILAIGVLGPSLARAEACSRVPTSEAGSIFYIDPARGSPDGDGSKAHPWRKLAEVLDFNRALVATSSEERKQSRVKAGDKLVLSGGDHGDVALQRVANGDFITVEAAPGEKPLVRSLHIRGASHWIFRGVNFQGTPSSEKPGGVLVQVIDSDNMVFTGNSFSSQDDFSGWKNDDWISKPYMYGFESRSRCTTLTLNRFYNLRNGAALGADDSSAEENHFSDIGNDSLDIYGSNLSVRHNTIAANRHNPAEKMHPDGIQGWSLPGVTNRNVTIDGNLIENVNLSDANYMQGISIFNGLWDGLTVSNNVVVSNHWHGIALYGVRNALVINNTLASVKPTSHPSWIKIHGSANNPSDVSAIVRNNIAYQIVIDAAHVTVDHNLTEKGVHSETSARNVGDASNLIVARLASNFKEFAPPDRIDLRLDERSRAIASGSADRAPPFDIDGHRRGLPTDIGAYAAH